MLATIARRQKREPTKEEHFSKTHSVHGLLLGLSEFWKSAPHYCAQDSSAPAIDRMHRSIAYFYQFNLICIMFLMHALF